MPRPPVYIVSQGIVTCIGMDVASNLQALMKEQSGIALPEILQTHWAGTLSVGEVRLGNAELARLSNVPDHWPRTALLSALAVEQAWSPFQKQKEFSVSFISANTV